MAEGSAVALLLVYRRCSTVCVHCHTVLIALNGCACNHRMYEFRLRPGETVVFNNRRMLHGRTQFQSKSPSSNRILNGCYVNIDEFQSRYR